MKRRTVLQLAGVSLVTTGSAGYLQSEGGADPIEFEQPEDLLLIPELLPGDGWESLDDDEPEFLDVNAGYVREFEEGEEIDGDEGDTWIIGSAVGAYENEADAVDVYEEFYADWNSQVGDARIMNFDLASEGAIAGYDGNTAAIFRDVNCVGAVTFSNCIGTSGHCNSHVGRTADLAQTKREFWRGSAQPSDESESAETDGESGEEGDNAPEFVDQMEGQVELQYGETARLSNGVEVTAHGIEIADQLGEEEPQERDAFALLQLEAVNNGEGAALLPSETDPGLYLLFEDQQVEQVFNYAAFGATEYEPYEGEEVQPGVRRSGYILYEVAGGLTESDIDFLWQDELFVAADLDGTINVRWAAG